ncbi:MAG: CopG family transcriptional regulator [Chloroflexota bacterium]|nr:CopG family transcriptional regulator [Chloroflexota bacterium]
MPRQHFSVRLSDHDRGRLAERSRETRVSESELARRYVSEGLRRDLHPAITMRPGRVGGRAALAAYPRLEVAVVVETWRQNERDIEATARYHAISPADVESALAYYADFPEEIDEIVERKRRITVRYERVFAASSPRG